MMLRFTFTLFVNYLQQRVAINKPTLINLLMRYAVEYGFNINKSDGTILKAICKRCLLKIKPKMVSYIIVNYAQYRLHILRQSSTSALFIDHESESKASISDSFFSSY